MRGYFTGVLAFFVIYFSENTIAQSWMNSAWPYRNKITIDNLKNSQSLAEYQIKLSIGKNSIDFSRISPQAADIRFTDSDGVTVLDHFIETFSADTVIAWIKIPTLAASEIKYIYMYYGNAAAQDISSGDSTFTYYDGFEFFRTKNAPQFLNTPTYDGSGQAVHPDVLYFPDGWHGYKYWMGLTPFENGSDPLENPSILVSDDGLNWINPPGVTNPLVPAPASPGWNNDPEMLIVGDSMYYYYNESNIDSNTYVKVLTSGDGINWTPPRTVFSFPYHLMSPAMIYEDSVFYMWYVRSNGCYDKQSFVYLRTSRDGINWEPEKTVSMGLSGKVVWHLNIVKEGKKYITLVSMYDRIYPDCARTSLYYGESTDKINWTITSKPVLAPVYNSWDNYNIYRVSFLIQDSRFRIWYSARGRPRLWHIGYTEGTLQEFLQATKWDQLSGDVSQSDETVRHDTASLKMKGSSPVPVIMKNLKGKYAVGLWLYDNMQLLDGEQFMLKLYDSMNRSIGIGINTNKSSEKYIYNAANSQFTETSIIRSRGWHRLEIRILNDNCELYIDDKFAASLNVLDENAVQKFQVEGNSSGITFLDDVMVRKISLPEPQALILLSPKISLKAKVLLEGPYDPAKGEMSTLIQSDIPLSSPYVTAPAKISSIPKDMVDWITVQLRSSPYSAPVYSKSALLFKDGRVMSVDGKSDIIDFEVQSGSYYIIINHRNHLSVMSSSTVELKDTAILYDFTRSNSSVYYGKSGIRSIGQGMYVMAAGDADGNGIINGTDYNLFNEDFEKSASGYLNTDFNLDGKVTGSDYNLFNPNYHDARKTSVP